jgi:hypothetical protein
MTIKNISLRKEKIKMNYYLILERQNDYEGDISNAENFLFQTEEELKSINPNPKWRNVVFSEYDEESNTYSEYEFTKISSIAFEEMKKDFPIWKKL